MLILNVSSFMGVSDVCTNRSLVSGLLPLTPAVRTGVGASPAPRLCGVLLKLVLQELPADTHRKPLVRPTGVHCHARTATHARILPGEFEA
jgi:hypothetical protein